MKYVIRLSTKLDTGLRLYLPEPVAALSEHTGAKNNKPITFQSIADAEVYAQDHEIHGFTVEAYND